MPYILFAFLIFYNNLINLLPPELHAKIYVGLNLVVLFSLFILSRHYLDLQMKEIGYEKRFFIRSIILGLISSFVIISLFVGILNILPLFNIGIGPPKLEIGGLKELLYRLFIRIPIGTAYFEENLFRGICYGYLVRKYSIKKTTIITSFLFAIWHIVPALKVVNSNFQIPLSFTGILFWIGGLFGAFLAGIFFAILRDKGKNISGCILSHALINDLSLLVIYYLWK